MNFISPIVPVAVADAGAAFNAAIFKDADVMLPATVVLPLNKTLNASDLARMLGVHASMGSKILKGQRSLTVDHLRKLADHFKVRPELFMA